MGKSSNFAKLFVVVAFAIAVSMIPATSLGIVLRFIGYFLIVYLLSIRFKESLKPSKILFFTLLPAILIKIIVSVRIWIIAIGLTKFDMLMSVSNWFFGIIGAVAGYLFYTLTRRSDKIAVAIISLAICVAYYFFISVRIDELIIAYHAQ